MTGFRMQPSVAAMLSAIILSAAAVPVSAQPLADMVPGDAMLYIGWRGLDHLGESYEQSHFKALYPAMGDDVISSTIGALAPVIARDDPRAARLLTQFASVADKLIQHPMAVSIHGFDPDNADAPVKMMLIVDAGDEADAIATDWKVFTERAGVTKELPMRRVGKTGLMLSMGEVKIASTRAESLAGKADFIASLGDARTDAVAAIYAPVKPWLDMIENEAIEFDDEREEWRAARRALDLDGMKSVSWTGRFVDRQWQSQLFVEAPAPRKGLAALITGPGKLNPATLAAIPATARIAGALKLDLSDTLAQLRTIAGGIDEQAPRMLDGGLAQLRDMTGIDLERDLFAALGPDWLWYGDDSVGGGGLLGMVAVNHFRDPKAAATIEQAITIANAIIAAQMQGENLKVQFIPIDVDGQRVWQLGVPFVAPSIAVNDKKLVFGLFPQTVVAALRQTPKSGEGIDRLAAFKALQQQLGARDVSSFAYADLPKTVDSSYATVLVGAQMYIGFGQMMGANPRALSIPPLDKLRPHLAPAASMGWADARGLHLRSRSPFPGASVYSPGQGPDQAGVGTVAVMAGILLPAMKRARVIANRAASSAQLRGLGTACVIHAQTAAGKFPPDLTTLVKSGLMTAKPCFHPQNKSWMNRVPDKPMLEWDNWIDKHTDYVYLGGDEDIPGDAIVAYEKLGKPWTRLGINILFGDGHVEWVPLDRAVQVLKRQGIANP